MKNYDVTSYTVAKQQAIDQLQRKVKHSRASALLLTPPLSLNR